MLSYVSTKYILAGIVTKNIVTMKLDNFLSTSKFISLHIS